VAGLGTKKSTNFRWSDKGAQVDEKTGAANQAGNPRKERKLTTTSWDSSSTAYAVTANRLDSRTLLCLISPSSSILFFLLRFSYFSVCCLISLIITVAVLSFYFLNLANLCSLRNLANIFSRKWEKHE
jgi:hypothetical protein